eukprot:7107493-Pyramimonas_sp.AAC.1
MVKRLIEGVTGRYAAEPSETVNYVSAHDNETLFDTYMLKSSPEADLQVLPSLTRLAPALVICSLPSRDRLPLRVYAALYPHAFGSCSWYMLSTLT